MITTTSLVEGLNSLKSILPKVRGREVSDYGLIIYGDGAGQILAEFKPPRMKTSQEFTQFILNRIPLRAKAEFKDPNELELFLNGRKELDFLFEDEEDTDE